uniref:hypothetical protein n=1 Tax=Sphingopyxis sp. MSC1_008 TaxID=2909265 RepID=UPI0020BF0C17
MVFEKVTFGTARTSSDPPSIFCSSSDLEEKADTEIGTSWIDSALFCAVTMISAGSLIACAGALAAASAGTALVIKAGSACAIFRAGLTMKILPLRR